jgi:cystathionine gamma-lyase
VWEVPTAGPPGPTSQARASCCWRPRPTPASTSATSPRSPPPRTRRRARAVDNTTATPLGQRPLELGADLTLASDTKALAGHDDVVLGHVSTRDPDWPPAARAAHAGRRRARARWRPGSPTAGSPTLDLRLARQAANAAALVEVLRGTRPSRRWRWPGHPDDPAHDLADRQMRRWNGVVGLTLGVRGRGGPVPRGGPARRVGHQLRRRAHQRRPQAALGRRGAARIPPAFRRAARTPDDLVADLRAALDACHITLA